MKNKKSFTFIEMLIVVAIAGMIIPAVFSLIFFAIQARTKIFRLSIAKKEGDFALSTIAGTIRNRATAIYLTNPPEDFNQICDSTSYLTPETSLVFKDTDGSWFKYLVENNKIASSSETVSTAASFFSDNVLVDNFSIFCEVSSDFSQPLIDISFDVCYKTSAGTCNSSRVEENAILHYHTLVKLRNAN